MALGWVVLVVLQPPALALGWSRDDHDHSRLTRAHPAGTLAGTTTVVPTSFVATTADRATGGRWAALTPRRPRVGEWPR
jgi:hypothetical protein